MPIHRPLAKQFFFSQRRVRRWVPLYVPTGSTEGSKPEGFCGRSSNYDQHTSAGTRSKRQCHSHWRNSLILLPQPRQPLRWECYGPGGWCQVRREMSKTEPLSWCRMSGFNELARHLSKIRQRSEGYKIIGKYLTFDQYLTWFDHVDGWLMFSINLMDGSCSGRWMARVQLVLSCALFSPVPSYLKAAAFSSHVQPVPNALSW